jgi:hypothetical protein
MTRYIGAKNLLLNPRQEHPCGTATLQNWNICARVLGTGSRASAVNIRQGDCTPRFPERPCSPDVPRQRLVGLCSGDIARARPSSTAAASVGSSSGAPAAKAGSSTSNAATAGTHPPGPPAGHSDLVRARGIHPQPGQDQRPCQLTCPAGPENAANIAARDQPPDFFRSKQLTRISEPHRSPGQGQESSSGTPRSVDRFG